MKEVFLSLNLETKLSPPICAPTFSEQGGSVRLDSSSCVPGNSRQGRLGRLICHGCMAEIKSLWCAVAWPRSEGCSLSQTLFAFSHFVCLTTHGGSVAPQRSRVGRCMAVHFALAFSTWRRPRGTVFRLANSSSTVLFSVAFGRCELDCAHEHRCSVAGHTQLSPRTRPHRDTARLKTPRLSHRHDVASVPRSAAGPPDPRLDTFTLVLSVAPHLSVLAGGTRPLSFAPHAVRVSLASPTPPALDVQHDHQVLF